MLAITRFFVTFFFTLFACISVPAQQTIRFEISGIPAVRSANDLYIAGSFNKWNPADPNYKFEKRADGSYFIILQLNKGPHEYKITRGSWSTTETTLTGRSLENRKLMVENDNLVELDIKQWQDNFPDGPLSTASAHVCVMDSAFPVPQLNTTRRISVYLPANYCNTREKYPVIYMQDGQNLFDENRAPYGEWGIDEFMDSTSIRKSIIVAIDHGGDTRINEYNPYDHARYGKGKGDAYIDFIVKELKPYIDKNFRTRRKKNDTFIAGSSMGGLISFIALLKYPKVFGGAGVFSPSFWIAPELSNLISERASRVNSKIYFYAGKDEGSEMVTHMLKVLEQVSVISKSKITTVIRDGAKHNEEAWRKEFPMFYRFILQE